MSYAPHVAFWAERGRALTAELVGGNREKLSGAQCARIASRALGLLPAGHGPVTMRIDPAYYAIELLHRLRKQQTRFTVSVPRTQAIWAALGRIDDAAWTDALDMPGAEVAETTYRPGGWCYEPLRLIVRRIPFTAEQIAKLKGSRRLQTIHPEQLQMALDGQLDSGGGAETLSRAIDGLTQLRVRHGDNLNRAMTDNEIQELRGWLQVAGGVADQLYLASGVFQANQRPANDRHADLAQRERLYHEAHDLLADLAGIGEPQAMYHLIEMLEGCIEFDPPGVFLLIAEAVRSSASWGYQFESMAEALVVRIVKHYMTERRKLFRHAPEPEAALADILDVFVEAGSPEAGRLVYGLSEIFR